MDIDFTMKGIPTELYTDFDKKELSHFITEKFGTATFITKKGVQYELTPLRTEGDYGDFRHPGKIQRSNSILLDSQRRDFSINAMYYFSVKKQSRAVLDFAKEGKILDEKSLISILDQEGYCYLTNLNLLILRDEGFIDQVFHEAVFDEDHFRYLIEIQKEAYFWGTEKGVEESINKFRILIDPTG